MKGSFNIPSSDHPVEMIVGNETLMKDHVLSLNKEAAETLDSWKDQAKSVMLTAIRTAAPGHGSIFPKTMSRLFSLAAKPPLDGPTLEETRRLQWKVSTAEEFIVKNSILGIRKAIFQFLGFSHLSGGRLPLRGALAKGAYEEWDEVLGQLAYEESKL